MTPFNIPALKGPFAAPTNGPFRADMHCWPYSQAFGLG